MSSAGNIDLQTSPDALMKLSTKDSKYGSSWSSDECHSSISEPKVGNLYTMKHYVQFSFFMHKGTIEIEHVV